MAALVREHGIPEQGFYRCKSKYGGMEISGAKRLKELEAELDKAMLMSQKW